MTQPETAINDMGTTLIVWAALLGEIAAGPHGVKPFVMTNLKTLAGLADVVHFIETKGMLTTA